LAEWKAFENRMGFTVYTSVNEAHIPRILDFIYDTYILPLGYRILRVERFRDFLGEALRFTIALDRGYVHVEIRASKILEFTIVWEGPVDKYTIEQIREDLIIAVRMFEDTIRKSSVFFTFVENSSPVPEKLMAKRRIVERIFTDSMITFFVAFLIVNMVIFMINPVLAPIAIVVLQFCILLFSHKIIMSLGDWKITARNQHVTILQYYMSPDEYRMLLDMIKVKGRNWLYQVKREIYEKTIVLGGRIDPNVVGEVLSRHGIPFRPENLKVKTFNVYRLVKEAVEEYGLPMPNIVLSNIIIPNASASGIGPRFGTVMVTAGLLASLEEGEVYAVLNHELSHLKGRDPVFLFTISTLEYLFRLYVLLPMMPFILFLPYVYFFFVMGLIYFIGKFFEAKSDLEAAIKTRQPQLLAEALRKIGYYRLRLERSPGYRLQSWIGWDPHPPLSFRIKRLENLKDLDRIKHPFLRSIVDVLKGFFEAIM